MNKKVFKSGVLLLLLSSCGDDQPLGELINGIDEELTQNVEIQEKWAAACVESNLLNASTRRMINFDGDDFSEEYKVYSDSQCSQEEGIIKLSGDFDIDGGNDEMNLNLTYKKLSVVANSSIAVDIFSAINLCGIDTWNVGQETTISSPSGEKCLVNTLPTTQYGKVFVDDSEDKLFLSAEFSDSPQERPDSVDRSLEFNEVD